MGGGGIVFDAHPEIVTDGLAAELDDRLPGLLDRTRKDRGDLLRRLGRVAAAAGSAVSIKLSIEDNLASP